MAFPGEPQILDTQVIWASMAAGTLGLEQSGYGAHLVRNPCGLGLVGHFLEQSPLASLSETLFDCVLACQPLRPSSRVQQGRSQRTQGGAQTPQEPGC